MSKKPMPSFEAGMKHFLGSRNGEEETAATFLLCWCPSCKQLVNDCGSKMLGEMGLCQGPSHIPMACVYFLGTQHQMLVLNMASIVPGGQI